MISLAEYLFSLTLGFFDSSLKLSEAKSFLDPVSSTS